MWGQRFCLPISAGRTDVTEKKENKTLLEFDCSRNFETGYLALLCSSAPGLLSAFPKLGDPFSCNVQERVL